jgi:hypothetical protein
LYEESTTIADLDLHGRVSFRNVLYASDDLRHVCERADPKTMLIDGGKGRWTEDIGGYEGFRATVNRF